MSWFPSEAEASDGCMKAWVPADESFLIKRAGEPEGGLMKQGHLGFTRGGRVSIATHLRCTIQSATVLSHVALSQSSVIWNKTKLSSHVLSRCLFAVTGGDVIA